MIKSLGKLTLVTILAALVVGVPVGVSAQDKTTPAPATPSTPAAKPTAFPFTGKLLSVDLVNKTITLDEKTKRVIAITSDTKLMKNGKPATLGDAVVGEAVGGRCTKSADGKYTAVSIRFGAKPDPNAAQPAK